MVLFASAPLVVANAPYESTMGLVQKIFYYHVPSAMLMFVSAFVCGIASAVFLFRRSRGGRPGRAGCAAELTVLFGLIVLVTGPLWARKAWGVWWQWDARLTSSLLLWMIFLAYLLVRRYGGPGSEKLRGGDGPVRHGERAVRLRLGQLLAHAAPEDERRPDARAGHARGRSGSAWRRS